MILAPDEQALRTTRLISVSRGNIWIHKLEKSWIFMPQFNGDVCWQLELWRLKERARPADDNFKVEMFLNGSRYCSASDITLEFPL